MSQPPFPLPQSVEIPIYFTIQPGGAYLAIHAGSWGKGAQLWYPNWHNSPPGSQFDFWNYDPEEKGWYVYGEGHVSKDSRNIIPDPGVELYQFTGAMVGSPNAAANTFPGRSRAGDPVDLSTGLFVYEKADLLLPDVMPLEFKRTYRPNDNQSRPLGIGTSASFELFLIGDTNPYTYLDLISPDVTRTHFYRTSFRNRILGCHLCAYGHPIELVWRNNCMEPIRISWCELGSDHKESKEILFSGRLWADKPCENGIAWHSRPIWQYRNDLARFIRQCHAGYLAQRPLHNVSARREQPHHPDSGQHWTHRSVPVRCSRAHSASHGCSGRNLAVLLRFE